MSLTINYDIKIQCSGCNFLDASFSTLIVLSILHIIFHMILYIFTISKFDRLIVNDYSKSIDQLIHLEDDDDDNNRNEKKKRKNPHMMIFNVLLDRIWLRRYVRFSFSLPKSQSSIVLCLHLFRHLLTLAKSSEAPLTWIIIPYYNPSYWHISCTSFLESIESPRWNKRITYLSNEHIALNRYKIRVPIEHRFTSRSIKLATKFKFVNIFIIKF